MLGCNYWDSEHGTDMWRYFDADVIEKDVKALSENGVKYMRVFPNWRDFQPIQKLYGYRGSSLTKNKSKYSKKNKIKYSLITYKISKLNHSFSNKAYK